MIKGFLLEIFDFGICLDRKILRIFFGQFDLSKDCFGY